MGLLQAMRAHLLYISVLLALISYIPYYIKYKQKETDLKALVSRSPFFIAHVLDPTVDNLQYTSWTGEQWENWLARREKMHAKANKNSGRVALTDKPINSVLIATASEFVNAFEGRRIPYNPHPENGNSNYNNNHMYWGEMPFSSFVFIRKGKNFRVYRCPLMYVAVMFAGEKPIHLHVHARKKDPREKVNPGQDCVAVRER